MHSLTHPVRCAPSKPTFPRIPASEPTLTPELFTSFLCRVLLCLLLAHSVSLCSPLFYKLTLSTSLLPSLQLSLSSILHSKVSLCLLSLCSCPTCLILSLCSPSFHCHSCMFSLCSPCLTVPYNITSPHLKVCTYLLLSHSSV